MEYRYHINRQIRKLRTKVAIFISSLALLGGGVALPLLLSGAVNADSSNINFETSQSYSIGNINGQNGWSALGSAGSGCAVYDEGVSSSNGIAGFGNQSFRISNAVTSGCFGDQAFAPALTQPAGEPGSLDRNGNPVASPMSYFESQFSIASSTGSEQPGLAISVSPDNGVGARMSYLRFVDQSDGIHVYFDDVTDPGHVTNGDSFNESDIATLSYTAPHTIKFSMYFVPGPDNDVVRIFIDGSLVHTGTSWEDYYRFDTESNPDLVNVSRTVDTMEFRAGGTAAPSTAGGGYLIDNLSMLSENPSLPTIPTIISPANGSVLTAAQLTQIDWTASTGTFAPMTYQYQAFSDPGYTNLVYSSGWLTSSDIPTPGTPIGNYYIQVRAQDSDGNISAWSNDSSNPYLITVRSPQISPTDKSQCMNNGWLNFNSPSFTNQGLCVSWVEHNVLGNGTPAAGKPSH